MKTPEKLNALKAALCAVLFPSAPPAEPVEAPQDGRPVNALGEVRMMALPLSRIPPEGYVFVADRDLRAIEDLDEEQRWTREIMEPLQIEYIEHYLTLCDLTARLNDAMDYRNRKWGANTQRKKDGKPTSGSAFSLDRSAVLERSFSDRVRFDDLKMQRAKALIEECMSEWEVGSRPEVRQLVTVAFRKSRNGQYSRVDLTRLRKIESADPRWQEAIKLTIDAEIVDGSAGYLLLKVRDANDQYHPLPLDIASVRPYRAPSVEKQQGEASRATG
jgi:hypothetical protein